MSSAPREIYKGRIIDVHLEPAALPNGKHITLELVHHPGAAAIVAVHADGTVPLLRQYRHAVGGYLWEVPAGTLAPGEDAETCARRELREEVGLTASAWTPLGSIVTSPGFCDERIHLFLARELHEGTAELDEDEVLTVSRVPLATALAMIHDGAIEDAKSIAALTRAAARIGG